jgi:phage terminase small subunit
MNKKPPGKYKLTRKQKAFADHLINNPKQSATKAVQATYNTKDYSTAGSIAVENLQKPAIQLYLDDHIQKAKNRIITLVDSEKEEIALRASDSILDRSLGKAVQRSEVQSTSVNLNLDLTTITDTKTE